MPAKEADLNGRLARLFAIAHYLVTSGAEIAEGDTVGPDAEATFKATLKSNSAMGFGPVYRLHVK